MSDYNDGYAEGRATYIDKLDEMTMQQEVDRKRIAELERDGMEPRAVLRSRIAELEAELAKAGSDIAGFSNLLLESQVRCQKLEAELAKTRIKLGEYAMMADPLTVSLKADNARLRECLKRIEEIV